MINAIARVGDSVRGTVRGTAVRGTVPAGARLRIVYRTRQHQIPSSIIVVPEACRHFNPPLWFCLLRRFSTIAHKHMPASSVIASSDAAERVSGIPAPRGGSLNERRDRTRPSVARAHRRSHLARARADARSDFERVSGTPKPPGAPAARNFEPWRTPRHLRSAISSPAWAERSISLQWPRRRPDSKIAAVRLGCRLPGCAGAEREAEALPEAALAPPDQGDERGWRSADRGAARRPLETPTVVQPSSPSSVAISASAASSSLQELARVRAASAAAMRRPTISAHRPSMVSTK